MLRIARVSYEQAEISPRWLKPADKAIALGPTALSALAVVWSFALMVTNHPSEVGGLTRMFIVLAIFSPLIGFACTQGLWGAFEARWERKLVAGDKVIPHPEDYNELAPANPQLNAKLQKAQESFTELHRCFLFHSKDEQVRLKPLLQEAALFLREWTLSGSPEGVAEPFHERVKLLHEASERRIRLEREDAARQEALRKEASASALLTRTRLELESVKAMPIELEAHKVYEKTLNPFGY